MVTDKFIGMRKFDSSKLRILLSENAFSFREWTGDCYFLENIRNEKCLIHQGKNTVESSVSWFCLSSLEGMKGDLSAHILAPESEDRLKVGNTLGWGACLVGLMGAPAICVIGSNASGLVAYIESKDIGNLKRKGNHIPDFIIDLRPKGFSEFPEKENTKKYPNKAVKVSSGKK